MTASLCLYELDRPALKQLSSELREALYDDDSVALGSFLELGDKLTARLGEAERLVDWFLRDDTDEAAAPLYASLRRVSKKRALTPLLSDAERSLEGRLRGFELLREDKALAAAIDKLLNPKRVPWYLRRRGCTCGWLDNDTRDELVRRCRPLRPSLTPELRRFADALEEAQGDIIAHDGL